MIDIPKMYGVTRMNHRVHNKLILGHYVRIQRDKERFVQFFSDTEFDGENGSLEAAIKYRDKILKDTSLPTRAQHSQTASRKSDSGIVGVTLHTAVDTRRRTKHAYDMWKAWWSPQIGKPKVRSFSVIKYGFEHARQMAIEARENGLKEMQDIDDSSLRSSKSKRRKQ